MNNYVLNPPVEKAGLACANSTAEQAVQFDCKSIAVVKGKDTLASIPLNIRLDSNRYSLEEVWVPANGTLSSGLIEANITGYNFVAVTVYYEKTIKDPRRLNYKIYNQEWEELGYATDDLWNGLEYVSILNDEIRNNPGPNMPWEKKIVFSNSTSKPVLLKILKSNNIDPV